MSEIRKSLWVLVDPDGEPDWSTVRPTEVEAFHARFARSTVKATADRQGYRVEPVQAIFTPRDRKKESREREARIASVVDALAALLKSTDGVARDVMIADHLAALPPDHPSHNLAHRFWRCTCGEVGMLTALAWSVDDAGRLDMPVCPKCAGEATVTMIEEQELVKS